MGSLYVGKEDFEYMRESMKPTKYTKFNSKLEKILIRSKVLPAEKTDYADNIRNSPHVKEE